MEALERRRAEDRHLRGEVVLVDQLDQRPRDRAVEDVGRIRPGGDEEDVDLVVGPRVADPVGPVHGVEPPLDLARLGQLARLRIVERLPGPAEHLGVVARNQEVKRFVPLARGIVENLAAPAVAEEFVEGFHAPPPQRIAHVLGVFGLGRERIIQKPFQIPAQLAHQVAVGTPLDREANRRGNGHRLGAASVLGDRLKLGRITRFDVPDEECIHAKAPRAAAPCRDSSCDSTMICKAMLWERWLPSPLQARLADEVEVLRRCRDWLERLKRGEEVVVNLRPETDAETEYVWFDRPRMRRVLARIIADLEELTAYPSGTAEERALDDETRRVQHCHRLAEPDPSSKPLTAREEGGRGKGTSLISTVREGRNLRDMHVNA